MDDRNWDFKIRLGSSREAVEVVKPPGRHAHVDNVPGDNGGGRRP